MIERAGRRVMLGPRPLPDGAVVICAANNWDDVRLSDRPLAERLARLAPVLYVDPPLSHLSPRRNPRLSAALDGPRLREAAPGLWRLTPVVTPMPFRRPVTPLTSAIVRRALHRTIRGTRLRGIVTTLLLIDVVDLAPGAPSAYWTQDDTASGARHWGQNPDRLLAGERRVAAACDMVLAASPLAAQRWRDRGYRSHELPNGCDVERFERETGTPVRVDLPHPVAGFVGHLNARTDLTLLHATLSAGASLLLVGPISASLAGPELDGLLSHPRVRAVGAQPYEDMARWLAAVDVGLVPYRDDDFNRLSFPLKILEYLAAGLPVAATDLPAVHWLGCHDVLPGRGAAEFAAAVMRGAASGRTADRVSARREFARGHSWDRRAHSLLDLLDAAPVQV
jgi:teichuronic acid biosynthesis glycosyltransferase TuaH